MCEQALVPKAFLADMPVGGRISYGSLDGDQWGRSLASDVMRLFCQALDEAPMMAAQLDTPEDLLSAFERAKTELGEPNNCVAVLAGDWFGIVVALPRGGHGDFVPAWQLPDDNRLAEWGEYRGHSFLRGPSDGEPRMYVVDHGSWGCFVRAQCEGEQDLRIDIKPVPSERARELLDANPNHFPDEPAYEDKLRKLQTHVELAVCHRVEFQVKNSSHARRIVSQGSSGDAPT